MIYLERYLGVAKAMQPIAIFFHRQFYQVQDKIVLFEVCVCMRKKFLVKKEAELMLLFM